MIMSLTGHRDTMSGEAFVIKCNKIKIKIEDKITSYKGKQTIETSRFLLWSAFSSGSVQSASVVTDQQVSECKPACVLRTADYLLSHATIRGRYQKV